MVLGTQLMISPGILIVLGLGFMMLLVISIVWVDVLVTGWDVGLFRQYVGRLVVASWRRGGDTRLLFESSMF